MAITDRIRQDAVIKPIKSYGKNMGENDILEKCRFTVEPSPRDGLIKASEAEENKTCFCDLIRSGEGEFVCGWDGRQKKVLRLPHDREPRKSNSSVSLASTHGASSGRLNVGANLRPWLNKGKAEAEAGESEYVFKHRPTAREYIDDYREKFCVGLSREPSSLGSGDCPDPYVSKLKHCGDLLERLKRLAHAEPLKRNERLLTPTVVRNKSVVEVMVGTRHDYDAMPVDGIHSMSLGLNVRHATKSSTSGNSSTPSTPTRHGPGKRSGAHSQSPSNVSSSSSEDLRHGGHTEANSHAHSRSNHDRTRRHATHRRGSRARTPQLTETNIPVAEIHFGAAPSKGKTWSSGSGQYLNLSFPKTTFPLPVRVALTPNGYLADGKGGETPTRVVAKHRDKVNLTPNPRATGTRSTSNRCATPRGLYTENGDPTRRRVSSESTVVTNCGGAFAKNLANRTSTSLGTLNSKVHS